MPFAFQLHTISGLLLMLLLYRNLSHSLRVSLSTRWAEANTFTKIRSFSLLWKCHYYHVTAQDITPSCQQTSHIVVQPLQSFPGHWKLLPNWDCVNYEFCISADCLCCICLVFEWPFTLFILCLIFSVCDLTVYLLWVWFDFKFTWLDFIIKCICIC